MAAPADPCEWCGGPQFWTIIHGEMYVLCQQGCLGFDFEASVNPLPCSEDPGIPADVKLPFGTNKREGGVPLEGGAAKVSDSEHSDLPF